MSKQLLTLFDEYNTIGRDIKKAKRNNKGGSANPIVFHDYESYVAKFQDKEKTTDDTYTPKDVYEAVVSYVGEMFDLTDKQILRPFYPGGDYENAEYPDNGVVIDNPPFSIFTKICKFYSENNIPFFLFGPGMTIMSVIKYCTVVIANASLIFENKANVKCNFATNIFDPNIAVMTVPMLSRLLNECPSQNITVDMPIIEKPDIVLSVSDLQTISHGGIEFVVKRNECAIIKEFGGRALFGNHILITQAKAKAKAKAQAKAKAKRTTVLHPTAKDLVLIKRINSQ